MIKGFQDVFIPVFSSNHNHQLMINFSTPDVFIPVFSSNHNYPVVLA